MSKPFSATAPIKPIKGTSSSPGIAFEEDTGIYSPNPNELSFTLGGSPVINFTGSGINVNGSISFEGELPLKNIPLGIIAGLSVALG